MPRWIVSRSGGRHPGPSALRIALMGAVCAGLLLAGCGSGKDEDDGSPPSSGYDVSDTGTDTTAPTDTDTSDTGEDGRSGPPDIDTGTAPQDADGGDDLCGETTCGADELCVDDSCVDAAQAQCDAASDLGTLEHGSSNTLTASGSFDGARDGLETTCASTSDAPERIYTFEVAKSSQIEVSTDFQGSFDAKLEFRQGECELGEDGLEENEQCLDSGRSFYAPAGSTWFLVVERDVGSGGSFDVDLTASPACSFGGLGSYGCKQGDRYLCERVNGSINEKQFSCASDCESGRCDGDSCGNPITITASSGGVFRGDLAAYTPKWNFSNNSTCKVNGTAVDTGGAEVVFELPGLQKNDKVSIDTSGDAHDNYLYVTRSCASSVGQFTCVETADSEQFTFTAPDPGDYYLIVDKGAVAPGPFEYQVEIK